MAPVSLHLLMLSVFLAGTAACGVNPDPVNASCCECAGYTGSGASCHWCPVASGTPGCKYRGSTAYTCAGFVSKRLDCPLPCAPISASPSSTPLHVSPSPSSSVISPSSSPGPAPSPGPLRPFSKKGVGYYGGKCSDFEAGGLDNVSWGYDWGHDKASLARSGCATEPNGKSFISGVEYVPMIWGKYALKNVSQMNTTYIRGASYIFSFNEPDHTGSSWLPPLEGAQRWPDMVALANLFNLTIIAPCVSNYNSGQWWLETWNKACVNITGANCTFDHTCLHTYFEPSDTSALFSSIQRLWDEYKRPIWLNEFACPPYKECSAADQLIFARDVVPRLEALPYIYRYAWFEARSGGNETLLANTTGVSLTPLGEYYNALQPNKSRSAL